ncbi:MAG: VCBS repeat-containing protein [bacterium]|nr:VCBS repeat-containing protein [bacterium]
MGFRNLKQKTAYMLFLGVIIAGCGADAPVGSGSTELTRQIEMVEETTESFANAMLDLSVAVRNGNTAVVRQHVADSIVAQPFPSVRGPESQVRAWILQNSWLIDDPASKISGDEWVDGLEVFRDTFSVIEDVRFKVKKSALASDGDTVEARVAFWLVGRNQQGRREKASAMAAAEGRLDAAGQWRLERFVLDRFDSMVAERDLFAEIAEPAGLLAAYQPTVGNAGPAYAAYGVAVADLDSNGFLDLLVTSAQGNNLYMNRGDGSFEDIADEALVRSVPTTCLAPLFLDYDRDGDQDLFLSAIGSQVLFENRQIPDGELRFFDVSLESGVARDAVGFSAVAGDVDGNGYADIYVTSYNRYGEILPDRWDGAENGTPNLLLLNQGDGTFSEVAAEWGVASRKWSYAASFADLDADGDLDLYVANDFGGPNHFYVNVGDHFVDRAADLGVADGGYGMGVDPGDFDNDGDLDLHVTRMSSTAGHRILSRLGADQLPSRERLQIMAAGNALYENLGNGRFTEVSSTRGPFSGGWAWGGGFVDIDNDTWQDLYTPNGFVSGSSLKDT